MNKKNNILILIIVILILFLVVLFLDYGNYLYFISKNFNYEFLGIFISNFVLIFIFLMTFYLIDSRNIEKSNKIDNNKINVLNMMLDRTYYTCKESLRLVINNSEMLEKFIIPKVDFNSNSNKIIDIQKNSPFSYDEQIMKMAFEGLVDWDILDKYLEIKRLFQSYVDMKITFYDIAKYKGNETKKIRSILDEDNNRINSLLDEEMKRIKDDMKGK